MLGPAQKKRNHLMSQNPLSALRSRFPSLQGMSDEDALDAVHSAFYSDMDKADLAGRLGMKLAPPPPPPAPEGPGFLRGAADTGLALGKGAVTGVKMISDAFGAENTVSQGLGKGRDWLASMESEYSKWEQQQSAAEMEAAKGTGIWNEVGAAVNSFKRRPLDMIVEAAGTSLPTLAAALLPGGQGAVAIRIGAMLGMGGVQGAGSVKGQIHQEVEQAWLKSGAAPEQARLRADEAQEYLGTNQGQIALGTALGAAAGVIGAEGSILAKRILAKAGSEAAETVAKQPTSLMGKALGYGKEGLKEGVPEAFQGGQEAFAGGSAVRNEGFEVNPWDGVAGSAALEGLAGFGMGAAANAVPSAKPDPLQKIADAKTGSEVIEAFNEGTADLMKPGGASSVVSQAAQLAGFTSPTDPLTEPTATVVDAPFADRVLNLRTQLANDTDRQLLREKVGDQALNEATYYLGLADDASNGLPNKTRENMLAMAEAIIDRGRLRDASRQEAGDPLAPRAGEPERIGGESLLRIGMDEGPARIGLDGTPTDTMVVDAQGNASPRTRAEEISLMQRARERDSLGQQAPTRQPGAALRPDGPPAIGYDTTPTGAMRVDGQGNVLPETRADQINTRQALAERESLGQQTPRGGAPAPAPAPGPRSLLQIAQDKTTTDRMVVDAAGNARPELRTEQVARENETAAQARARQLAADMGLTPDVIRAQQLRQGGKPDAGGDEAQPGGVGGNGGPGPGTPPSSGGVVSNGRAVPPVPANRADGGDGAGQGEAGAAGALSGPAASWVIREKATGQVVLETFDKKKVDALNTQRYEAVPIREHLAGLSQKPETSSGAQEQGGALSTALPEAQLRERVPGGLFVQAGKQRFQVDSLRDAQTKWAEFRDTTGAGVSQVGNGVSVVDGAGRQVAHVSYNGRLWNNEKAERLLAEAPDDSAQDQAGGTPAEGAGTSRPTPAPPTTEAATTEAATTGAPAAPKVFQTKSAATVEARKRGGKVEKVEGGYVVKPKPVKANPNKTLNPDDTMLDAVAKLGGISRESAGRFGLAKEEQRYQVRVGNGKLAWVFRVNGGRTVDDMREVLAEAGYFDGVPADEQMSALEDAIKAEIGGSPRYSTEGMMRREEQRAREESEDARAETERMLAEEDAAERAAIMAENGQSEAMQAALADDDLDALPTQSGADAMRALGFTEDEINEAESQGAREPREGSAAQEVDSESDEAEAARPRSLPETDELGESQAGSRPQRLSDGERAEIEREYTLHPDRILGELLRNDEALKLYRQAGQRSAMTFEGLPIDRRAKAYADFVEAGGTRVEVPADYNAMVARRERDATTRRLQSDATVSQANGKPFKTELSARGFASENGLEDTHEPTQAGTGWILRKLPPAAVAERKRKAEGRESYTEAQTAVAQEMGIGETSDGELDATDAQFEELERRTQARLRGEKASPTAAPAREASGIDGLWERGAGGIYRMSHKGRQYGRVMAREIKKGTWRWVASDGTEFVTQSEAEKHEADAVAYEIRVDDERDQLEQAYRDAGREPTLSIEQFLREIEDGTERGHTVAEAREKLPTARNELAAVQAGTKSPRSVVGAGGTKAQAVRWMENHIARLEERIASGGMSEPTNRSNYNYRLRDELRGQKVTDDTLAPAGSLIVDAKGKVYRVHSHRHHTIQAHAIVDGKPQVSADTTVRFWTQPDANLTPPGDNDRRDPVWEVRGEPAQEPATGSRRKAYEVQADLANFDQESRRQAYTLTNDDAPDRWRGRPEQWVKNTETGKAAFRRALKTVDKRRAEERALLERELADSIPEGRQEPARDADLDALRDQADELVEALSEAKLDRVAALLGMSDTGNAYAFISNQIMRDPQDVLDVLRRPDNQDGGELLTSQTEADLAEQAKRQEAADKAERAEQKRLADRDKANAELGEFTLTGSDSPRDVGAAVGQGDMFDAPAEEFGGTTAEPTANTAKPTADIDPEQYAQLEGATVEQEVTVEETGQTVKLRLDAASALRQLDERRKTLEGLKACIGGRP
jgi:hypothetical protein